MNPLVSVIIPTYNGANYLGEAIRSVLDQTYSNFELIVVDDASTDHTAQVVSQFEDARLKYIVHTENQGSDRARYTGLQASSGEIIALLDQDDLFHPEKIQAHVEFLEKHPDIGFTYNARIELNYSATTIRDLWRPPRNITLADLVLWFPLSPSDVVLRRKWALEMDLPGGTRGAEILHFSRLYLSGCKFACVDRALNSRRYHSGRINKDLYSSCMSELNNQAQVFSDPRCPLEIIALRDIAHANIYIYWSYLAFIQQETASGQEFLLNAVRHQPSILEGMPSHLVNYLVTNSIDDESVNHATLLQRVFDQFPPEIAQLSVQYDWAVARGYLLKGVRAIMWDRPEDGHKHFEQAIKLGAQIDESFIQQLTYHLLDYEAAFGEIAARRIIDSWAPHIENLGGRASVRHLYGSYAINRAFQSYHTEEYNKVPRTVIQAVASDPRYLANRGVLAMLLRSTVVKQTIFTRAV